MYTWGCEMLSFHPSVTKSAQSITKRWKSWVHTDTRNLRRPWKFPLSLLNPSVPLADVQAWQTAWIPAPADTCKRDFKSGARRDRDTLGTKWPRCSRCNGRVGYRFVGARMPTVSHKHTYVRTYAPHARCASRVHQRPYVLRRIAYARGGERARRESQL